MSRWLGFTVVLVLPACTSNESDGVDSAREQLSAAAQPIYDAMRWDGMAVPRSCDDAGGLSGVDPVADPVALDAAATMLAGEVLQGFTFDPVEGRLNVDTIERDILAGPDLTDDTLLRERVTAVVAAMGGAEDQLVLEVSGTNVVGGEPGEDDIVQMLEKTVTIQRLVLDLPVGDNGNAGFEMHGPLISMRATWRRFDYDASELCVDGLTSEAQVMAALAEHLVADGFELEPTTIELEASTTYRPIDPTEPGSDTWTMRLVGTVAIIDSRGGTIPTLAFYLDDGSALHD